ncbi:hypothetical protein [Vibrio vulnificus]|uniref:hypothetical protein n=1 Tax=Vibrio vulnificus TaxID=672 RepID=UPI003ED97356
MVRTHTKFNKPVNRVGALLTLDELLVIWSDAKECIDSLELGLNVSVYVESCSVWISAKDDLTKIVISQHHMHPQALVHRELGKSSKIKTPTAKRLTALVKEYF